ncbi:MAG: hypothetical protein HQM08_03795 [Candidatus Riflebacteria bacterium]|nr:hypothetical protein [Candidatus Riflebacteria bacterium]
MIDLRLMIFSHPLFRAFDFETKRFRETPSEPLSSGMSSLKELAQTIIDKENEIKDFDSRFFASNESKKGADLKKIQEEYLQKKKRLASEIDKLKARFEYAFFSADHPGVTPDHSIIPEINSILKDIQKVLLVLKSKYHANIVFDISGFLPVEEEKIDLPTLRNSPFLALYQAPIDRTTVFPWVESAKAKLREILPYQTPILYGASDARLEAVEMIKKVSEE